mgnify:CR=1 FL=1
MKYYSNDIYPVALVLSFDAESVDKEYYNACERRTNDYFAMAVGIIFNKKEPSIRLQAHEAFHATRMIAEIGCHIYLDDQSEEAWAYLQGWVMKCIDEFLKEEQP